MGISTGYATPLLFVAEVERSIAFYGRLGFQVVDVEGTPGALGWARMHCEGGALMFVRSDDPVPRGAHDRCLLYLYTSDLAGLRAALVAAGLAPGEIARPSYMPSGEMRVPDPDGHTVLVGHWGQAEHEAWERQRAAKRAAGVLPADA